MGSWQEVIDQLLRIRNYPEDWDGHGSPAPDKAIVDSAIGGVQTLIKDGTKRPADRVIATVNGTVTFEWFEPDEYQELEVVGVNRLEYRKTPMRPVEKL